MVRANLNKSVWLVTNTTTASEFIPKRTRIYINWNPPFQTQIYLVKVPLNVNIEQVDLLHKKQVFLQFYEARSKKGDSGPRRYVLWCHGGICYQPDTFIQIGSGHTVKGKFYSEDVDKMVKMPVMWIFFAPELGGKFKMMNGTKVDILYSNCSHITFELK